MDYLEINKATWDKRTATHLSSEFYNVDGFLKGETSLKEIELDELISVKGKSLLHLQCHFGLDTLSWARKGARVTGVDLSSEAIAQANILKQKTQLEADFICADVYSFANMSERQYDIVFTSYGAVCWLPDINQWAKTVASQLKPGGTFYMVEFHPIYDLISGYSYFHKAEPDLEDEQTYTENATEESLSTALWSHTLGDVVSALITQGIQIKHLHEFPYSPYNCFKDMQEKQPGKFYLKHQQQNVPLVYSILGSKNHPD
jgi:SAM-dependent methyltransferase